MTSWLNRLRTEVHPATNALNNNTTTSPQTPLTPRAAARTRDPNSPDYRFNINQKCIYERRLPGGSYITAHIQRLQSGYYDSPMVHEDLIENVRFVAVNFVFHPSRSNYRFKTAEVRVALHREDGDAREPVALVGKGLRIGGGSGRGKVWVEERQGGGGRGDGDGRALQEQSQSRALIRSQDAVNGTMTGQRSYNSPPRFLRHAPHLLFGSISPETLNWNFKLAGSLGVTQGPANATLQPSGGMDGSYKRYEMMRIQGSMRGLHSWFGKVYNVEDAEIVWTLEENRLQKSGLPREFTFVMLLTKGTGTESYDGQDGFGEVRLDIDINPVVAGFMGMKNASYPSMVTNMLHYQPLHKDLVDLDQEIGQRFQPEVPGRGFNFAALAKDFDEFVWMPGTTWSTKEGGGGTMEESGQKPEDARPDPQQSGGDAKPPKGTSQPQLSLLGSDNTLNLRVFLESSRGSPIPALPYASLNLKPQPPYPSSRGPSPLHVVPAPPSTTSTAPSKSNSKRRSITIVSAAHPGKQHTNTTTRQPPHDTPQRNISNATDRRTSRSPTLRRRNSRSSLDKEYRSSPPTARLSTDSHHNRPFTMHEPFLTSTSKSQRNATLNTASSQRPVSWYEHTPTHPLPPRTSESGATDTGTVVHHSDPRRQNLPQSTAQGQGPEGEDSPLLGREDRRASSYSHSHRSNSERRVKTRQAKVTQTPYPGDEPAGEGRYRGQGGLNIASASTSGANADASSNTRTRKVRALKYGDESSTSSEAEAEVGHLPAATAAKHANQPQRRANTHGNDAVAERDEEEGDLDESQVPIIAVPRKSSRRQSAAHLLQGGGDLKRDSGSSQESAGPEVINGVSNLHADSGGSSGHTHAQATNLHDLAQQRGNGAVTMFDHLPIGANGNNDANASANSRGGVISDHMDGPQPHPQPQSQPQPQPQRSTSALFHDAPESLPTTSTTITNNASSELGKDGVYNARNVF